MAFLRDGALDIRYREDLGAAEGVRSKHGIDAAEFQFLYEQTARPLWAYLARVSGNRDVANDLLQESYCRFLSAELPPMDQAGRRSYLFRIATNLLNDRWRRQEPITLGDVPEGACEDQLESRAALRHAFEQLKPRERQFLWLAHVEGSDHREIARRTGVKPASVRLLLFRARRRLAGLLRNRVAPTEERVSL
jgi:RNA polymerase sigma-70 factor (ECF subfamily)